MTRTLLTVSITIAASLSLGVARAQDGLPPPNTAENGLERRLAERMLAALEEGSFEARNTASANAVTAESAFLANRSAGIEDAGRQAEIRRIFRAATLEAGAAFKPAFGTGPQAELEAAYKTAMNAPGEIAFRALGPTMEQVEPGLAGQPGLAAKLAEQTIERATIEDVARIVASDLRLGEPPVQGRELLKTIDRVVPQEDFFRDEIERIQTRQAGERPMFSAELKTLNVGIRMANATWKAGQVHRAARERSTKRITPGPGSAFNTFDALKQGLYQETRSEYHSRNWEGYEKAAFLPEAPGGRMDQMIQKAATKHAFARVVFEVWKDVIELKKAQRANVASEQARARHEQAREAFQRQLAEERAAELRRFTVPQLLVRAKAQGVEVSPSMSKPELVARISGQTALETTTLEASASKAKTGGFTDLLERVGQRGGGKGRARGR